MIGLKPPTIELGIRIGVLHRVIEELVEAFYPTANFNTIKKGILERQYFKTLYIYFLNKAGNKVGEVTITIDWDKHSVATNTLNKATFDIDTTKSVTEQLSEVYPQIIDYVQTIKQHLDVHDTEMWFGWREEIYNNEEKLREACQYCGFTQENKGNEPVWEKVDTTKIKVYFSAGNLNELGLEVVHLK